MVKLWKDYETLAELMVLNIESHTKQSQRESRTSAVQDEGYEMAKSVLLTLAKAAQDYEDMLNDYSKFCAEGYIPYDGYKQFVWKHFDSPKYKEYLDEKKREEAEEAAREENETED